MRYNPDNMPLHKSGSICGYLIWRANQINAAIDKYDNISNEKVYLGWSNPNYNRKNKWYSLSHLKFDYFQEISQSNCFVGISLDKLGNKKYRIFKPRISNLKKEFDVVTYPAISGETYWDFEWLPDARVFKVYKLSGDCAILIPPRWKQCNNVPFNDIDYDPYSLFRYWPNTEFGHFKDFVFTNDILFGENYNGTLDVISSKGEIISILWSDLKITCDGISFRNRNNIQENVDFSDIETYHNRELSEMSESLNPSFESDTHILGNTEMDGPATQNVPLPVIVDDGEDIRWIYKNFEIQYDGKTTHFKNTNNRIRPENLILCVGRRASENNAYIVRYGGRNVRFHLIERKFELPSEVSALRNRLKTGELPIPMHYLPKMSDDELIESFKAINSNFDSIGTNKKETDFCN